MKPPLASDCYGLLPSNQRGLLCVGQVLAMTSLGVLLSSRASMAAWVAGQLLLALAFVQWFVILHECAHETMFRDSRLNRAFGHVASFFSLIPLQCWKRVHSSHHRWTGWQDLDPTTASLVPRPLRTFERLLINLSWRFWIPVFSVIYRIQNYWNLPRLRKFYRNGQHWPPMLFNAIGLIFLYIAALVAIGPRQVAALSGVGLIASFVLQDLLILSQHTHIPQKISSGLNVRPFTALEQEAFTRSLRFPPWVSKHLLFNFDAHELHHMYPFVPGYYLRRISYVGRNEIGCWTWIRAAKGIRGEDFLFRNQNDTGIRV